MDTFTLEYRAPWPTSLVLSREALTKYRAPVPAVNHCKRVERRPRAWRARSRAAAAWAAGSQARGAREETARTCPAAHAAFHAELRALPDHGGYRPQLGLLGKQRRGGDGGRAHRRARRVPRRLPQGGHAVLAHDATKAGRHREDMRRVRRRGGERWRRRRRPGASSSPADLDVVRDVLVLESSFDECVKELLFALNRSAHTEPNLSSLCARLDFNEYYTYGPGGSIDTREGHLLVALERSCRSAAIAARRGGSPSRTKIKCPPATSSCAAIRAPFDRAPAPPARASPSGARTRSSDSSVKPGLGRHRWNQCWHIRKPWNPARSHHVPASPPERPVGGEPTLARPQRRRDDEKVATVGRVRAQIPNLNRTR